MIKLTKSKAITIFAILMLCLNLVLIAMLFLRKPPMHKPMGPKSKIIEQLDFNDAQIKAYELLIQAHQAEMKDLKDEILLNKTSLYQSLSADNEAERDSIIDLIGRLNKTIEYTNYEHFLDIEALCTSEQLTKFEVLKENLGELFKGKMKPPKQ